MDATGGIDGIPGLRTVNELVGGDQGLVGIQYDDQGWGGYHTVFRELIARVRPKIVVEIGTWKGRSAMHMAECLEAEGLVDSKIICIDTWLGAEEFIDAPDDDPKRGLMRRMGWPSVFYQFLSNVDYRALGRYIVPLTQPSSIGLRYLLNRGVKADLVYIDGSHNFTDVLDDLMGAHRILSSNGLMFGDDYCEHWEGVIRAVNAWADDKAVIEHRHYDNAKGEPPSDYWIANDLQRTPW